MVEVLVFDAVVVQERDVRLRGAGVLQQRESQGGQRQHAEAAGPDGANRCVSRQDGRSCQPAADEAEEASGFRERARPQAPTGGLRDVAQFQPGAGRQIEQPAIDQADFDLPAGSDLDDVTLANGIASYDLNRYAAGTRDRAATDRRPNSANHTGRLAQNGHARVPELYAGRNKHWLFAC
ncbi:hypothetical protein BE61_17690 [Bradyrhizobium elkanii USDA 61]|nr:hypothetical protein BE61_17690 [Bradyrhizobium elkanii USDA 61]